MLLLQQSISSMPPHPPSFRNEFKEWWSDEIRSQRPSFHTISFFVYSYEKGWIAKRALLPFYPLGMLLAGCICMVFAGPFPNTTITAMALLMVGCMVWLAAEVSACCRLALIDLVFYALPLGLLAWGNSGLV